MYVQSLLFDNKPDFYFALYLLFASCALLLPLGVRSGPSGGLEHGFDLMLDGERSSRSGDRSLDGLWRTGCV